MNLIQTSGQTFSASMVTTFVFRGQAPARGVNNIPADAVPRAEVHRLYRRAVHFTIWRRFTAGLHCKCNTLQLVRKAVTAVRKLTVAQLHYVQTWMRQ